MSDRWNCLTPPETAFAGLPVCRDLDQLKADLAVIGLHYVSPYPSTLEEAARAPEWESGPNAVRRLASHFAGYWDHIDFNLDGPLLAGREPSLVDCGDLYCGTAQGVNDTKLITEAVRTIISRGALPMVIGEDEGSLTALLRGFEGQGRIFLVHIDAHIDWRDERDGVKEGFSSGMRRASEMPWISGMAQVGLRGLGSARAEELEAAEAYGSILIRARELHQKGVEYVLSRIPQAERYLVTIDCDGFDLAMAPGVLFPSPGGVTFHQMTDLFRGLALRGNIAGVNLYEFRPQRDVNDITANTAAHLLINFMGALAHSGQLGGSDQ
jgi:agmatinase